MFLFVKQRDGYCASIIRYHRVHSGAPKVINLIDETELRESENTEVCADCFGTGTKIDPVKGAMPCPCRRPDRFKRLLVTARIPPRYSRCSFDTFKCARGSSQDNALLASQRLVDEFPADRGLLFMGPTGVVQSRLST